MKFAEKIIRTFEHKPIDRVIWQPRIMYWYRNNKIRRLKPWNYKKVAQFVPKEYRGASITQIYDDLQASIRYNTETLHIPIFYQMWKVGSRIIPTVKFQKDGSRTSAVTENSGAA